MEGFFTVSRVLALIAAIIFIVAAIGQWPDDLRDDLEPIALGLAFLALSFAIPGTLVAPRRRR